VVISLHAWGKSGLKVLDIHIHTAVLSNYSVLLNIDRITVRHVPVLSSSVQVVDLARDLGVVIDSHLTMVDHVTAVCRAAYFHLRQLRLITRSLSVDAAKTLVQSFTTCHLDYCNALFSDCLSVYENSRSNLGEGLSYIIHVTREICIAFYVEFKPIRFLSV